MLHSPSPVRPRINWFIPATPGADNPRDALLPILEAVSREADLIVWRRLKPVPTDFQNVADVRQWPGHGWVELNTGDVTLYSVTSDTSSDWVREVATHHSGVVLLQSGSWHLTWPPLARQRGVIVDSTALFEQMTAMDCCPVAHIPVGDHAEDYARAVMAASLRMMKTPTNLPALLSTTVARVLADGPLNPGAQEHLATRVSAELNTWIRGSRDPK